MRRVEPDATTVAGMTASPRPLFVTRRFPPAVGGMETLALEMWDEIDARFPGAVLVAHRKSNRGFAQFALQAWWQVFRARLGRRVDVVIVGDVTTYLMVWPLLAVLRLPSVVMAHGLDLTLPNPVYHAAVRFMVPRAKRVLTNSEATAEVARGVGVAADRCVVVRLGAIPPEPSTPEEMTAATREARRRCGMDTERDQLLLTVGRLIARKGVRWFVTDVMPKLPDTVHYAIAGAGPELEPVAPQSWRQASKRACTCSAGSTRPTASSSCAAPTSSCSRTLRRGRHGGIRARRRRGGAGRGTVVVASALEGLCEAIVDGETGFLVEPENAEAWQAKLVALLADPDGLRASGERFQVAAVERYALDTLGDALEGALRAAHR